MQCDLCGTKRRHRANVNRTWAFRPILRPECIDAILREVGSLKQGTAYCKGVAEKDPLVSRCEAMPKAGPSPLEWKRRLEAFA